MKQSSSMLNAAGIVVATAMLVAACSSSGGGPGTGANISPASTGTSTAPPSSGTVSGSSNKTIGFLLGVQNNPFYQTEQCWAQIAAQQQGYTVKFQAPAAFDVSQEDQVTLALAADHPAGLIVDPVFGDQQIPTIKQVLGQHIPVATVEEPVDVPGQVINVTAEHQLLGKMAADLLAKAIGGKGEVYVSDYQAGVQSTDARREGFLAEIKKYPGITYVGNDFTGSDTSKAASVMTSEILRHPNLKGIFGTNLYSIQGDISALQQSGKLSQVTIISTDVLPNEIQWLKNKQVYALIAQKPGVIAATAVDTMISYLQGKRPAMNKTYLLSDPFVAVTRDNMNSPDISQYFYTTGDCSGISPDTVKKIASHLPPTT